LGRLITAKKETLATLTGMTDDSGKATVTYLCSGIAGVDSIFAEGVNKNEKAHVTIALKADDFEELGSGTNYVLVGSTSSHPKNHFGTAGTIKRLKALADSSNADSSWILQYNDISLQHGGPFDVSSDHYWDTPHQTHRSGVTVDMRPTSIDGKTVNLKWLRDLFKRHDWGSIQEEAKGKVGHHYHLTIK
jgi:hypothetical protein